jgi:hypothetical protein
MDAHNIRTDNSLRKQTQSASSRTQQMGRTHTCILHHWLRWTLWINRRHIGISLQTHTSRRTTTIRCTTTTIWTSTPSGLPTTSTTIYYTNLPPMRKSGARKLAFLPQLRQTTKLAKLKPKSVFGFLENSIFFNSSENKKGKFRFSWFQLLFPEPRHPEASFPSKTR